MKLGSEVFLEKFSTKYKGKKIGLLTNITGVNHELEPTIDLFATHSDINLTTLFGPEHGIRGEAKEGEWVESSIDSFTNVPIYNLYDQDKEPNKSILDNIDIVFCDLQDIGVRYYTFIYTLANVMELCGAEGKKVVVLDRPNPINGNDVEGNIVKDGYKSFVGQFSIPVRHGLTIGELAILFKEEFQIKCDLEVIKMEGWSRSDYFDETDLHWVSPTPNATNINMCTLYAGTCLIEGINISEGRGTTRPFEVVGAPFINGRELSKELSTYNVEGIIFRPTVFKPMYQKYAGEVCEGVQIHITNRSKLNSFYLGVSLIAASYKLYRNEVTFIRSPDFNNRYFLDLLAGTDELRRQLNKGNVMDFLTDIPQEVSHFKKVREAYLLY